MCRGGRGECTEVSNQIDHNETWDCQKLKTPTCVDFLRWNWSLLLQVLTHCMRGNLRSTLSLFIIRKGQSFGDYHPTLVQCIHPALHLSLPPLAAYTHYSSLHLGLWDINIYLSLTYLHCMLLLSSIEQYCCGLMIYKIRSIHPLSTMHIQSQNCPLIPPPFQFYTVRPLSLYIQSQYCPFQFPNHHTFDPKIIIKSLHLNFHLLSFNNWSTLVWSYWWKHRAFAYL